MAKKNEDAVSFEKSLDRLEEIVKEMEDGEIPLDSMIARFEEGQGLLKICRKKLNEVQKKVEALVKKEGALETEEIDELSSEPDELF